MLSDFTEGFIGKVRIRKSGKVQLVIGDITMDVSEGAAFSFLQVRLHTAAQVKNGCQIVLHFCLSSTVVLSPGDVDHQPLHFGLVPPPPQFSLIN